MIFLMIRLKIVAGMCVIENTLISRNRGLTLSRVTGAVAEVVDSLDDIEILEESDRLLRPEVLNAVDDHRLRIILEVSVRGNLRLCKKSRENSSSIKNMSG